MSRKFSAAVLAAAMLFSNTALAHTPIRGIGSFYNGLLHPVLVPAHLLILVAVGLFFGQQGPKKIEAALAAFAVATLLGLVASWFSIGAAIGVGMETAILVLATAIGLIIAISIEIKLPWCIAIATVAGFFLGLDSAQDSLSGKAKLLTLFGSGIAIYFLALYPMALAEYFYRKTWQKIVIRIVGSWIAASSMLVLALSLSKKI